jgi:nucleoside-diphosphate kinase
MERTLIVFKPDSVMRGIVGEILTRFERVGLKIVGAKMFRPGYEHYFQHYEGIGTLKTRKGEQVFESQMREMQQGPVIAMVLEGVEAIEQVRKMVGPTEPKSAQPGTIRGDYSHITYGHVVSAKRSLPNVIHASANPEEATKEIAHWFSDGELFEYEPVHAHFTQPKPQA